MQSKGNYKQNEETTYGIGENMCKWCDGQETNFHNVQTAHTAQYRKKPKQPNQKNGQEI